jgi:glycosyltransferase involved in cell wall biosynthesis
MYISVIVPVYNEEDNIRPLHEGLAPVLAGLGRTYEILFVDDGSTDGTHDELRHVAKQDPHVRVVELRRNYGQTAAMDAGLRHAEGEIVVTMDGDLQNDPADIPMMVAKIEEGYDLVHGCGRTARTPSSIASCRA